MAPNKKTREHRRHQEAIMHGLTVACMLLFTLLLMLCLMDAPATADGPASAGRLPGDTVPAETCCYITPAQLDEIEEAENQRIEAALLAKATRLDHVTVTHYCICEKCCGKAPGHPAYGITASGRRAAPGVSVAVDPAVIPLDSDVLVDYGDGTIHYYRADDTGCGVRGNHIDLCVGSHQEALELGAKTATVYFVEG